MVQELRGVKQVKALPCSAGVCGAAMEARLNWIHVSPAVGPTVLVVLESLPLGLLLIFWASDMPVFALEAYDRMASIRYVDSSHPRNSIYLPV